MQQGYSAIEIDESHLWRAPIPRKAGRNCLTTMVVRWSYSGHALVGYGMPEAALTAHGGQLPRRPKIRSSNVSYLFPRTCCRVQRRTAFVES